MFVQTGFAIFGNSSHTTKAKRDDSADFLIEFYLIAKPGFSFPLPSKVTGRNRQSDPSPNPWIIRCSPIYGKALQLFFFSGNIHCLPTNLETVACVAKPFIGECLRNVCFGVLAVQGTKSSVEAKK